MSVSAHKSIVYLLSAGLIITGLCIIAGIKAGLSGDILATFWFICVLLFQIPKLAVNLNSGPLWTTTFESLAICGGALLIAGMSSEAEATLPDQKNLSRKAINLGRIFYGVSLPVFGVLHFVFIDYVARVQPSWIPGHVFWGYFTGVAHIAGGLSIVTKIKARLASSLVALMFGLWVVLLHIPLVMANTHSDNLVSSLVIAATMCGGALLVYGCLRQYSEEQVEPQSKERQATAPRQSAST
ncbi:MAG TPA: hypothetical protein VFC63_17840 [Blastocatellia bacterium]|nr:hypothetical protein [Blastocatellia bacterium]